MAKKERKETKTVKGVYPVSECGWKSYRHLDEFCRGLKEKKIIGSHCTQCGRVYVPPRYICGRCFRWIDDRTTVSDKGTVVNFMVSEPLEKGTKVMGMDVIGMGIVEEGERMITVTVRWDGADSVSDFSLEGMDPEDVQVGMRVRAVWRDKPRGQMRDIDHVEPMEVK